MTRVLVAGSTGYLGGFLVREAKRRGYVVRALTRSRQKLSHIESDVDEIVVGEVTRPDTLRGVAEGVDVVISAIGITRQKDGLTYRDVDYQGNVNLLNEALAGGVAKFIYVSVFHTPQMRDLRIVRAKELFVGRLRDAGLAYTVIRPNGYFSDMRAFVDMAKKGRVFLFGRGDFRINPVSGHDVAVRCLDAMDSDDRETSFGGPTTYTHRQIAEEAFLALAATPRISCVPVAFARLMMSLMRVLTPASVHGPVEFILTVLTRDMVARPCGDDALPDYFCEQVRSTRD